MSILKKTITSSQTKVVEQLIIHRQPLDPTQLFEQVITPKTRYLVLDLDRTIHRGVNIGERLGWEIIANSTYGTAQMEAADPGRSDSRFFVDWRTPYRAAHYMTRGVRLWAYPGLYYLFFGKIAWKFRWSRSLLHRYFGAEPISAVQNIPRLALMHHLAEMPLDSIREIGRRLWKRLENKQVFHRSDFDALRQKFPQLTIVLSSGSPQPVVEVAAEKLGITHVIYSEVEELGGYLSSPHNHEWQYLLLRNPARIAPPCTLKHNAAKAKRQHLVERFPAFCDPDCETVGITDTSYGEDHDWANFCTRVVDVNSPTPFSPFVSTSSPIREIHSVTIDPLTHRSGRNELDSEYYQANRLARLLGLERHEIEGLEAERAELAVDLYDQCAPIAISLAQVEQSMQELIAQYNEHGEAAPPQILKKLRRALRHQKRLVRQRRRLLRPLSKLRGDIREVKTRARLLLNEAMVVSPDDYLVPVPTCP